MQMLHEIKFINLLIKIHGGGGFKIILNLRPPRPLSRLLIRTQQERGSGGGMSARERDIMQLLLAAVHAFSHLSPPQQKLLRTDGGDLPRAGAHTPKSAREPSELIELSSATTSQTLSSKF